MAYYRYTFIEHGIRRSCTYGTWNGAITHAMRDITKGSARPVELVCFDGPAAEPALHYYGGDIRQYALRNGFVPKPPKTSLLARIIAR